MTCIVLLQSNIDYVTTIEAFILNYMYQIPVKVIFSYGMLVSTMPSVFDVSRKKNLLWNNLSKNKPLGFGLTLHVQERP